MNQRDPTIEDSYVRAETIDKQLVMFHIMDTVAPRPDDDFGDAVVKRSIQEYSRAYIIVYNMCSVESFQAAEKYLCLIDEVKVGSPTPIIVLATHADQAAQRTVSKEDGQFFTKKCGTYASYIEIALLDADFREGNNTAAQNTFFELARLNRRVQIDTNEITVSNKRSNCIIS